MSTSGIITSEIKILVSYFHEEAKSILLECKQCRTLFMRLVQSLPRKEISYDRNS